MSHDPEAHDSLQATYGRAREGRRQSREIRAMRRRNQVLAAQQRSAPEEVEVRSFRPRHVGHWLQWVRTSAAVFQALATSLILLRVFEVV